LRAKLGEVPVGDVMDDTVKGVHPRVGARKTLIKALSDPLERTRLIGK